MANAYYNSRALFFHTVCWKEYLRENHVPSLLKPNICNKIKTNFYFFFSSLALQDLLYFILVTYNFEQVDISRELFFLELFELILCF